MDNIEKFFNPVEVTEDNYFTQTGHLSNSFIRAYERCPSQAFDKYVFNPDQESEFKQCFCQGHLFEGYLENGEEGFQAVLDREDYKEHVRQKNGKLYKWVEDVKIYAQAMIKQEFIMQYKKHKDLKSQVILTAKFGKAHLKCAIDGLNLPMGYYLDDKSTKNAFNETSWNPEKRKKETFIDAWNYWGQLANYRFMIFENYGKMLVPYITAATKKKVPDVAIFQFSSQASLQRLDEEQLKNEALIDSIMKDLERLRDNQEANIHSCGHCDFCVENKVVSSVIDAAAYCERGSIY